MDAETASTLLKIVGFSSAAGLFYGTTMTSVQINVETYFYMVENKVSDTEIKKRLGNTMNEKFGYFLSYPGRLLAKNKLEREARK